MRSFRLKVGAMLPRNICFCDAHMYYVSAMAAALSLLPCGNLMKR